MPHEIRSAKAQQSLADACGLAYVATEERIGRLRGFLPDDGEPIDLEEAVFAEHVPGISLDLLVGRFQPKDAARILKKIPKETIRDAVLIYSV